MNDIERLTTFILTEKLKIKRKDHSKYSIVLVIPDVFQRDQVKQMINMFLITYEFSAIYVHCESVLATFGACISTACVVDIGYQKINVACVEEGVIVPNTLFRKNYGGEDLDMVLYRLC
jgi:actin-related protein 8